MSTTVKIEVTLKELSNLSMHEMGQIASGGLGPAAQKSLYLLVQSLALAEAARSKRPLKFEGA